LKLTGVGADAIEVTLYADETLLGRTSVQGTAPGCALKRLRR
jgi:hypothetical protein